MAASLAVGMGLTGAVAAGTASADAATRSIAPHPAVIRPMAFHPAPGDHAPAGPAEHLPTAPHPAGPAQVSSPKVSLAHLKLVAAAGLPRFDSSHTSAITFAVDSTADSPNANPTTGTTCVDTETTPLCSLRAAIEAANNIGAGSSPAPVVITVPQGTYDLTSDTPLYVSDPAGLSIEGAGEASTIINGENATTVLEEYPPSETALPPDLFVSKLAVTDGYDSSGGGGFYAEDYDYNGAVLSLTDVEVSNNSADTYDGGGIYASDVNLYLADSTVTLNHADSGAGIYAEDAVVDAEGSSIDTNSTTTGEDGYGGGLYTEYDAVSMTGGSISGNTAGDVTGDPGEGGGIYDDDESTFDLSGVSIDGNAAEYEGYGGGIASYFGTFDITGGSISDDLAGANDGYGGGGGIYDDEDAAYTLDGVTMTKDTLFGTAEGQGYGGGAIYVEPHYYASEFTIENSTISEANNSAIYVYGDQGSATWNITGTSFKDNWDDASNGGLYDESGYGCGGAFCVSDDEYLSETVNLTKDSFTGNTSSGYFGAGAIVDFQNYYDGASVSLSGDRFTDNSSSGEYGAGAVLVSNYEDAPIDLSASNSTFTGNTAPNDGLGGAIDAYSYEADSPETVDLTGDRFTNNVVGAASCDEECYGGAIYVSYYANLTDHGSSFTGNSALGYEAGGGAIYDDGYDGQDLVGTSFAGNSAVGDESYGGAVYSSAEAGSVYDDVTMSANSAEYGGALYGYYVAVIENSTFSGNTAPADSSNSGYGGAIYLDDGPTRIVNSTFTGNKAEAEGSTSPGYGGAIFSESYYPIALDYSTVARNSTENVTGNTAGTGAGLYSNESSGSILSSIVSDNTTLLSGKSTESDCAASAPEYSLTSAGHNVLGDKTCSPTGTLQSSDVVTTSPGLKALAHNGGPTETMALSSTSPAIKRADGPLCPATDERGQPRSPSSCDAGAYQYARGAIFSIKPASGKAGTHVTLTGSGYTFARKVTFGSKYAHFKVLSNSKIVAVVPRGYASGRKVTVRVYTPDGHGRTATFKYT